MTRKRFYNHETIEKGVSLIQGVRQAVLPQGFPVFERHQQDMRAEQQPAIETQIGHCTGCRGPKNFEVEGSETMKNGALRKHGKCPDCGRGMSTFVSGKAGDGTS